MSTPHNVRRHRRTETGWLSCSYVEGGACRLVSRNRNAFKTFEPLAQAIRQELSGRSAILDGASAGATVAPWFLLIMSDSRPATKTS